MLNQIKGLHHVTSMAQDANINNHFFTKVLGQRRIKKTVNFDAPDVYHLYYGDEIGSPGSVMTYFPFPNMQNGTQGTGEVGTTAYSVPKGSLSFWSKRFEQHGVRDAVISSRFGETRIDFSAPDGEKFALVESDDKRAPWVGNGVAEDVAIRGFHSASMRLKNTDQTKELLEFMNHRVLDVKDGVTRMIVEDGNGANLIDLEEMPTVSQARQGAGSVHHIAFAVENRAAQLEVREALLDTGYQVTPVINRDYFHAIYFRTPRGILFEIATNEPGFDIDEDVANLGTALKLPSQHEHMRTDIESFLQPIQD